MSRHALFIVILVQTNKLRVQSQHHDLIADYLKHAQLGRSTKFFNPNYGYEPYWENGEWFFKEKEMPPGYTTTAIPLVCGEECIDLYTTVGQICGRQVNNLNFHGCVPNSMSWFCPGYELDNHAPGYHTFDTYCEFLDWQCRTDFYNKWILVHRGKCAYPENKILKPRFNQWEISGRANSDLTSLASLFDNYTIVNTIFGDKTEELMEDLDPQYI